MFSFRWLVDRPISILKYFVCGKSPDVFLNSDTPDGCISQVIWLYGSEQG